MAARRDLDAAIALVDVDERHPVHDAIGRVLGVGMVLMPRQQGTLAGLPVDAHRLVRGHHDQIGAHEPLREREHGGVHREAMHRGQPSGGAEDRFADGRIGERRGGEAIVEGRAARGRPATRLVGERDEAAQLVADVVEQGRGQQVAHDHRAVARMEVVEAARAVTGELDPQVDVSRSHGHPRR